MFLAGTRERVLGHPGDGRHRHVLNWRWKISETYLNSFLQSGRTPWASVKQFACMDLLFCSNHNAGSVGDIRQRGREDWMGTFADWQDAPSLRTWPLHASDQSVCVTHWHWGWEGWKYVIVLSKIKECNKGTWDVRNLYVPPSDHYKMNSIFSIRFSPEIVKFSMYSVHPCASKVSLIKQW